MEKAGSASKAPSTPGSASKGKGRRKTEGEETPAGDDTAGKRKSTALDILCRVRENTHKLHPAHTPRIS